MAPLAAKYGIIFGHFWITRLIFTDIMIGVWYGCVVNEVEHFQVTFKNLLLHYGAIGAPSGKQLSYFGYFRYGVHALIILIDRNDGRRGLNL